MADVKKVLKVFLYVIGGLAAFIAVIVVAVLFFTADLTKTADEFFAAVRGNDMARARTYLSEDFKTGTSDDALVEFLSANALTDVREASWGERSRDGIRGSLVGSVTTGNGGVVPISLSFVKGANGWKIYAIQKPAAGLGDEAATTAAPSESEQVRLVSDAMRVFGRAVNARSMTGMYDYVAYLWKQQITPKDLDDAFGGFYDSGLDLTVLDGMAPRFDGPGEVDENDILRIAGHYPTKPSRVIFKHGYVYEGLGWKLVQFSVDVKTVE